MAKTGTSLKILSSNFRLAAAGLIGASALAMSAGGVFASLNATVSNTTPQNVAAGTLGLSLSNATFSANITNLAPGDQVIRYVDLKSDGTLDAQKLTLKIASEGTASLITNGTGSATNKAVTVTVTSCSQAWTDGTCSGTPSIEIAATPLSTFATAQAFLKNPDMKAGSTAHLQITVTLPDQNETTTNSERPAWTVQGGSVNLTYTFDEGQRTATTVSE